MSTDLIRSDDAWVGRDGRCIACGEQVGTPHKDDCEVFFWNGEQWTEAQIEAFQAAAHSGIAFTRATADPLHVDLVPLADIYDVGEPEK